MAPLASTIENHYQQMIPAHMEHCRICAESCRACADACKALFAPKASA